VKGLVEKLNDRPMRRLKKSRRQLFEECERAALKPLPARPYELAVWTRPKVNIDYHIAFEEHSYSVPYQLLGEQLDLRATETTVELFRAGVRVTSHLRSGIKHSYSTKLEHMPRGHRDYAEWTPPRLVNWAKSVGPATAALVEEILRAKKHPEHGFKPCLGIMRLREKYPLERIELACARAVKHRACSYRSVVAILQHKLDKAESVAEPSQTPLPLHGNVRGGDYYN
jgi:hypothetical protein